MEELGPFWINDDGETLRLNPYAWNREANLLVIDSPAGVGLSYTTDFNVTTGDEQVMKTNTSHDDIFTSFEGRR